MHGGFAMCYRSAGCYQLHLQDALARSAIPHLASRWVHVSIRRLLGGSRDQAHPAAATGAPAALPARGGCPRWVVPGVHWPPLRRLTPSGATERLLDPGADPRSRRGNPDYSPAPCTLVTTPSELISKFSHRPPSVIYPPHAAREGQQLQEIANRAPAEGQPALRRFAGG